MAIKNLGRVVGLSAYEVWLENGNTGTEEDFLNSLKGKDGGNGTYMGTEEPTDDAVIWVDTDEDGEVFEEDVFKKEMETYCTNYIDTQITQAIGGAY